MLLALNLVIFLGHDALGLSKAMSVRISLLSAAVWWAGFTLIPFLRLRDYAPPARGRRAGRPVRSAASASSWTTLREMRNYPMTLTFLLAYLFYNDGIQTVIYVASTYGEKQLGFGHLGADRHDPADPVRGLRRRAALRPAGGSASASYRLILWGTFAWMVHRGGRAVPARAATSPLFLVRGGRDRRS